MFNKFPIIPNTHKHGNTIEFIINFIFSTNTLGSVQTNSLVFYELLYEKEDIAVALSMTFSRLLFIVLAVL